MSLNLSFPSGRRLRLAVIGGGPGSFIGAMHRQAAALDNRLRTRLQRRYRRIRRRVRVPGANSVCRPIASMPRVSR